MRTRPERRDPGIAGELFIEYALLVALFALPVAAACLRLGFPVLRMFRYAQLALASPFT